MFNFGLSPSEVIGYYCYGGYHALEVYERDPDLKRVIDQLVNGFLPAPQEEFQTIYNSLLAHNDEFFVLKDFASYADTQCRAGKTYTDRKKWLEMSIVNIAHSGKFASDRTISKYASDVWNLKQVIVE